MYIYIHTTPLTPGVASHLQLCPHWAIGQPEILGLTRVHPGSIRTPLWSYSGFDGTQPGRRWSLSTILPPPILYGA